jgi:hypothetical protein
MPAIVHIGRAELPDRRRNMTLETVWIDAHGNPHRIEVSPGFYKNGRIGEVFARTARPDTTLDTLLDEGCQLISRLLQRGCPLSEIVRGMGFDGAGRAETPLGLVVKTLIELEAGR